jgi:5-methylcytosine-specific restriction endonuclease McrA
MTELVELQHWRCPWCGDYLPDSPRGTAIDHIIPRVYGGPHRRWNLQLLHQECNSAKGKKITPGAKAAPEPTGAAAPSPSMTASPASLACRGAMRRGWVSCRHQAF